MTGVFIKRQSWAEGYEEKEDNMNRQEEDSHLQTQQRSLEYILPLQPSEGTNPADTLISETDLQNCRLILFCYLSPQVCDTLLHQSR